MPDDPTAPLRFAHLASLHCGAIRYRPDLLKSAIADVNACEPDAVLVAGDLTSAGYEWEYEEALAHLDELEAPTLSVPGNHDSKNVGYIHFERMVGPRYHTWRLPLDPDRAEAVGADGVTVVALDSSQPDLDDGHVGREWYPWLREQVRAHPDDLSIVMLHHHLVAIPGAGRDLNHIVDAGDVLPILDELAVDVVMTGHKHVPYFWGLNGILLCNAGTVSTTELRGTVPSSWNELEIDRETVRVYLRYDGGKRQLAAVRSRSSKASVRASLRVTDDFVESNHLPDLSRSTH
ncbi:MAG: metallophosphoesterase [Nitriliruptorales bacterium]|nr:metallophosphoesterase [Nitriliruptorales bacterium]